MSESPPFIKARFVGPRFAGKLAISAMPELIAYERLVIETASQLYREETRRRLPPGFGKSFALTIARIEPGSNIAYAERVAHAGGVQLDLVGTNPFDKARDLISEIISAASSGEDVSDLASTEVLSLFEKFGASLGQQDRLDLETISPNGRTEVSYNRQVRKRISLASKFQYTEAHEDIGRIDAANRHRLTFGFSPVEGPRIDGAIAAVSKDIVREVTLANHTKEYVRIFGTGTYDKSRMLSYTLERIELLGVPSLDFEARLVELFSLESGWLDGSGQEVDHEGSYIAREILRALIWDYRFKPPFLYPTEDGGIRAEWTEGEVELSIDFERLSAYAHVLDVGSGESKEESWSLDSAENVAVAARGMIEFLSDVVPHEDLRGDSDA